MPKRPRRHRTAMSNLGNHAQKRRKVADASDAVSVHSEASSSSSQSERAPQPPSGKHAPRQRQTEDAMARLQERQRRALEIYNSLSSGGEYRSPTNAQRTQADIGPPATGAPSLPPPSAETATS
ncbi:hypothetical protein NUW54_g8295 [Trametes sanguinea]|uniref:Uncharacterized protein n=1 Tax=Trametes sanguinea TaxID=158606 RepID=A0ACC1PGC6_9APHY|nr:hypothetical protein NUW54_g8295 [Trametes sanguinea]